MQCGAGRPRAPSPRPSAVRPSRHSPPLPCSSPPALSHGVGELGPARRAKPGAGGELEKGQAAKQHSPGVPRFARPKCSGARERLWARPGAGPRFCGSSLLTFTMPKLGTRGWQKALDAPKRVERYVWCGFLLPGARERGQCRRRSWKIAATAAGLKPKRSETPRRGDAGCLEFSLHQKFISLI